MNKAEMFAEYIRTELCAGGERSEKIIKTFYNRFDGCMTLWKVEFLELGEVLFRFTTQDSRYELNPCNVIYDSKMRRWRFTTHPVTWVSSAEIAERAGLPVSFFEGFIFCMDEIFERVSINDLIEKNSKLVTEEAQEILWRAREGQRHAVKLINQAFERASKDKAVMRRLERLARKRIRNHDLAEVTIAKHSQSLKDICESHSMPSVHDRHPCSVTAAINKDPFPGIYTAWEDGRCAYVGKSVNVPQRLKSHDKVKMSDSVIFIEMDRSEIHFAEMYYIWLLRPFRNGEGLKTYSEHSYDMETV